MAKKRVFVGLPVTAAARRAVDGVIRELGEDCSGVRWSLPEDLHVTLAFLGSVEESRIDDLVEAMVGSVHGAESFGVAVTGVGAFPDDEAPKVVWVGLADGRSALAALQQSVAEAYADLGFDFDDRPFVPHITIGRVGRPESRSMVARAMWPHRRRELGAMAVTEVALYASQPDPAGSRYRVLASAVLG